MLWIAFALLLLAAMLGTALTAWHLRPGAAPPWLPGALHGLLGLAGFVVLLPALNGPPRGVALGVGAFGRVAGVLAALALLVGLGILALRLRRRRVPGLVIGVHATIAVSAVVVLAAYTLVG